MNAILEQQRFMTKVYSWMAYALALSGVTSYLAFSNTELMNFVFGNKLNFYLLLIFEVMLVLCLSWFIKRISSKTAILAFSIYAFTTGLTLSVIFFVFQLNSIISIFFTTTTLFALMSGYGYTTKKDLSGIGFFLLMMLTGLVITSLFNIFLHQSESLLLSWIGVATFVGLTAYDTQKIKQMNIIGNEGTDEDKKEAIFGALTLYLDYINLFLKLLRIFGKRK